MPFPGQMVHPYSSHQAPSVSGLGGPCYVGASTPERGCSGTTAIWRGSVTLQAMAKAFRTIRNFTDRLRQALCTATGPPLGGRIDAAAIQIRFSSA